MNLGINSESAPITHAGLEAGAAITAVPGAATPAQSAFGPWMAQAMRMHGAVAAAGAEPVPEGAPSTLPPELALSLMEPSAQDDEIGIEQTQEAALGLAPAWFGPGMPAIGQISVGPGLQAITGSTTLPDEGSLAAFARQQGLDAAAIAWLMNRPETAPMAPVSPEGSGTPVATAQSPGGPLATGSVPMATPSWLQGGVAGGPAGSALFVPPSPANPGGDAAARPPAASLGVPATMTVIAGTPAAAAVPAAAGAPNVAAPLLTAVGALAWAQTMAPDTSATPTPPDEPQSPLTPGAMAWNAALRWSAGVDTPATALRLAAGQAAAASQGTARTPVESSLDLSGLAWPEQGEAGTDAATTAPSGATGHAALPAGSEPTAASRLAIGPNLARTEQPAVANPQAAVDQMQQLAEQMADAVGERMLRELERGHWSLKLMLKPAHLGHIEVEMRLRAGELDATFAAPQAATRELLQDGLNRLRESLQQAGMDVANLDVRNGQSRQNGGDSTPGQRPLAHERRTAEPGNVTAPMVEPTPRPRHSDGWDVMV